MIRCQRTFPDADHSQEEHRFIIIGASERGTILVVSHTDDGELVRIISAREATHTERRAYEED
ncbi:MAG: BrnT family toxin [Pyrinomonadaceae bacterium]